MRQMLLVLLGLLTFALLISIALGYLSQQSWGRVPASRGSDARLQPVAAFYASGDMGIDIGFGRPIVRAITDGGVLLITLNSLAFFAIGEHAARSKRWSDRRLSVRLRNIAQTKSY